MNSLNKTARITGILYLLITVLSPFSMIYVPSKLIVPGNAATTASNIMASQGLFRAGMASDAAVFLIEIALSALLYILLKPVNKTLALVMAFSRLANAVIQAVNLLILFVPLLLLSGTSFLAVFEPGQLQATVLLFLNAHASGVLIWGLFFGLHLFALGVLIAKSGYMPRLVGILLVIAGLCYLTQDFGMILFPQYAGVFTTIGLFSTVEIVLPLWLLIKGVKVQQPAAATGELMASNEFGNS